MTFLLPICYTQNMYRNAGVYWSLELQPHEYHIHRPVQQLLILNGAPCQNKQRLAYPIESNLNYHYSCTQSMHALKILQSHGMSSNALKVIYKSVVLYKLFYASPHGGVLPLRLTSNGLMHSCVEESGSTCTALSTPQCHNMWRILRMNFSVLCWRTLITSYITSYLTVPLTHTLSDLADMTVH